ncbi:hypothetical protein [Brevibacillus reuszeri]|uniref:hypothetical protein n=1 Tax=Brevibacillus reuszeri TaxID=54915 RepID=UPI00289BAEC1|nr:hypothetical protein [Brevibacillus reuszeri]
MNNEKKERVICQSAGTYVNALTRGKEYAIVVNDEVKQQIKIVGDNGRSRWFCKSLFLPAGSHVTTMVSWQYDDEIKDRSEKSLEHIEVTITFSDGEKRWCSLCTKNGLFDYIERNMEGCVFLIENKIVVQNFSDEVVDVALRSLDQQNQLVRSTKPL